MRKNSVGDSRTEEFKNLKAVIDALYLSFTWKVVCSTRAGLEVDYYMTSRNHLTLPHQMLGPTGL